MDRTLLYILIIIIATSCSEPELQPVYSGIGSVEHLSDGGIAIHSHSRTFISPTRPNSICDSARVVFRVSADKRLTDSAEVYDSEILSISDDIRRSLMTNRKGIDTLGSETNILVTDLSLTRDFGNLDYINIITAYATCDNNQEHTRLVLESRDDKEAILWIRHWQKKNDNLNVIGRDTMCVLANTLLSSKDERILLHIKWKPNDEEIREQKFSYKHSEFKQ